MKRAASPWLVALLVACVVAGWAVPSRSVEVDLLAFGDWGWPDSRAQRATAQRMTAYARENRVRFDAALLLGDNFYGKLPGGVDDPRWRTGFEEMYDAQSLSMPFYVALGNHDYSAKSVETELAYAKRHPESRWKMPAHWYRVELPAGKPLVSVLVLDSNVQQLGEKWKEQRAWLERELARPRPGKWLIAIAHHPLVSNGEHGDTKWLLEEWAPLFRKHRLDFYLCGHDHGLQHLELDGWPTSFVVAGGAGADAGEIERHDRGPFSRAVHGFFHLHLTLRDARGKLVSAEGEVLHEFSRSVGGEVKVLVDDRSGAAR
jgi:hypothetical protein